jgi:hypothetical protein
VVAKEIEDGALVRLVAHIDNTQAYAGAAGRASGVRPFRRGGSCAPNVAEPQPSREDVRYYSSVGPCPPIARPPSSLRPHKQKDPRTAEIYLGRVRLRNGRSRTPRQASRRSPRPDNRKPANTGLSEFGSGCLGNLCPAPENDSVGRLWADR